jgi:hypothetical protein
MCTGRPSQRRRPVEARDSVLPNRGGSIQGVVGVGGANGGRGGWIAVLSCGITIFPHVDNRIEAGFPGLDCGDGAPFGAASVSSSAREGEAPR